MLKNEPEVDKLVVRTSQMASSFFEKFGFATTDIQKDFWAPGIDLHYMEMGNED
jgi:hypothetical protein